MTLDVEIKDVPIKAKMSDGSSEIFLTLILKHLRGRASVAVLSRERVLNAKLEGWPEVFQHELITFSAVIFKIYLFLDFVGDGDFRPK